MYILSPQSSSPTSGVLHTRVDSLVSGNFTGYRQLGCLRLYIRGCGRDCHGILPGVHCYRFLLYFPIAHCSLMSGGRCGGWGGGGECENPPPRNGRHCGAAGGGRKVINRHPSPRLGTIGGLGGGNRVSQNFHFELRGLPAVSFC
jgi:hypothetical protein